MFKATHDVQLHHQLRCLLVTELVTEFLFLIVLKLQVRQEQELSSDVGTPGNLFSVEGLKVKLGMFRILRLVRWNVSCFGDFYLV